MERLGLRFDGGLASNGQLYYYEYTRSQYATARFISTLEHFRRTGSVASRITGAANIDIIVETPQRGSFYEVLLVAVQEGAATAVSTQLTSLISLVWNMILPRSERNDSDLVRISEIRRDELISQNQTRVAEFGTLERIIADQNATTRQALSLVETALNSNNPALGRNDIDQRRLLEIQDSLRLEDERQSSINQDREALEGIDQDSLSKLTSRLRPMIPEMALPLRRSATGLSIETGDRPRRLISINSRNVAEITEKSLEDEVVEITVRVKSYDRDRGVGKVSSEQLDRQLNFVVSPSDQSRLLLQILDAMTRPSVQFLCRRYIDRSGLPTSLLLVDVV